MLHRVTTIFKFEVLRTFTALQFAVFFALRPHPNYATFMLVFIVTRFVAGCNRPAASLNTTVN